MIVLCVFGSRAVKNLHVVSTRIEAGLAELGLTPADVDLAIDGDAGGVDKLSRQWARKQGIETAPRPAAWKDLNRTPRAIRRGKFGYYNALAGHNRNQEMAEEATHFVGIMREDSPGSADMAKRVRGLGKPLSLFVLQNDGTWRHENH